MSFGDTSFVSSNELQQLRDRIARLEGEYERLQRLWLEDRVAHAATRRALTQVRDVFARQGADHFAVVEQLLFNLRRVAADQNL